MFQQSLGSTGLSPSCTFFVQFLIHWNLATMSSLTDKPLPMNQLCVAMIQDLGKVYENNAAHEKNDLNTVWESMYSKGLHRKVSSQCYFTPEEIEEARRAEEREKKDEEEKKKEKAKEREKQEEKEQQKKEDDQVFHDDAMVEEAEEAPRDFASVHMSRAINSGRAHMHDEGRRYRKRTFSGSGSFSETHVH